MIDPRIVYKLRIQMTPCFEGILNTIRQKNPQEQLSKFNTTAIPSSVLLLVSAGQTWGGPRIGNLKAEFETSDTIFNIAEIFDIFW